MATLYALRHGIAAEKDLREYPKDHLRALTKRGVFEIKEIGRWLRKRKISFDVIFSSPYVRALKTAEIISKKLNLPQKLKIMPELASGTHSQLLLNRIKQCLSKNECILIVGHEPDLSALISVLLTGNSGVNIVLKKGGLCKLEMRFAGQGCEASLHWLLTPHEMIRHKKLTGKNEF